MSEEGAPNDGSSTALVLRAEAPLRPGDEVRLQTLWLSLQRRPWRSLALVAADKGVSTLDTANSLAQISWAYTGQPATVFDLRDLSLRLLEHQTRDMGEQLQQGERVFVALRSPAENPTASPIAMAADAAVLCVVLGQTDIKSAQQAVAAIGRDRFVGTILVSPSRDPDEPGP
ncbi:MAG: hypothetical protein ACRELB_24180 [Polyangiaceae bacterium]